jgi:epoxyqueuosine reductase QueG
MDNNQITRLVKQFVATDPRNVIPEVPGFAIYEKPLIAYAAADDQIYGKLKHEGIIGPHHLSPTEWLSGARSVASWFLPFSKEIVTSNRVEGLPSKEWYLSRWWGEEFNNALRDHVVGEIMKSGHRAVAPPLTDRFVIMNNASNWSERHTAYIAGLGTFSLSYSFITERGCAGRFGSVITDIALAASERTAVSLMENCIYDGKGTCGDCISRCPAGAISPERKDHTKCAMYITEKILSEYPQKYNGIFTGGCGKCQTAVRCARTNPNKKTKKSDS